MKELDFQNTNDKQQPIPHGASILIILMGSIGDVVRGLSLVSALNHARPDCNIYWLVEPICYPIVEGHPNIKKVFLFARAEGIGGVKKLIKDLSGYKFDITLDLQRHFKSGFFSWLSGAPRRIGFNRRNAKELNWLFNTETIPYYPDSLPKILHYLKFIEYLGLEVSTPSFDCDYITPSESAQSLLHGLSHPAIGLVLGSSWSSKNWPKKHNLDFVECLTKRQSSNREMPLPALVLIGGKSQSSLAESIETKFGKVLTVVNSVGKTGIRDLFWLMKQLVIVVGPDSGPGHICAAVGTKYISLFGPTSPERTAPYGMEELVIKAGVNCSPCYMKKCPFNNRHKNLCCMKEISPSYVVERVFSFLE